MSFLLIFLFFGLPFIVTADQCNKKNRSVLKGLFLTGLLTPFFLGWVVAIGLWLSLKTRDRDSKTLY